MEIPVVIHKDENSVYGVSVPDVPGCFSWGDTVDAALMNVKEAVYAHVQALVSEGLPVNIGRSRIEDLADNPDYANGIWALVSLDLSKFDTRPERINVSIPRFVLNKIDNYAQSRHETRSGLLARAALQLIDTESKATEP